VNDDRLHALLSAYAAGTLTTEERQALFAAALERQDLFNSLIETEPLRELLENPSIKEKLLADLAPTPPKPLRTWRWSPRLLATAGGISLLLVAGVTLSVWFRERSLTTSQEPLEVAQAERHDEVVYKADSQPAKELALAPSKESPRQRKGQKEVVGGAIGGMPSRGPSQNRPEPQRLNSASVTARELEALRSEVRLAGESLNSPRAVFLASQLSPALVSQESQMDRMVATTKGSPNAQAGSQILLVLPSNAAMRLTFHAPGSAVGLDWRAPLPNDSLLRVDPTVAGYITVVATDDGTQPNFLVNGEAAVPHSPVDVSLAKIATRRNLTVIFSAERLLEQSLSDVVKQATGKTEELHTAAEQALYVSPQKESPWIMANLRIELR
jgi:hypothetical protein